MIMFRYFKANILRLKWVWIANTCESFFVNSLKFGKTVKKVFFNLTRSVEDCGGIFAGTTKKICEIKFSKFVGRSIRCGGLNIYEKLEILTI